LMLVSTQLMSGGSMSSCNAPVKSLDEVLEGD